VELHVKDKVTVWKPNFICGCIGIFFSYSFLLVSFNVLIYLFIYLFIYLWFKDAKASSGGLIGEKLIISNSEAIGRDETLVGYLIIYQRGLRKARETSIRIDGVLTDIRTGCLPNKSHNLYHLNRRVRWYT